MSKKIVLHVYHGGGFQRMPHLVYCEGNISGFECDAKKLSIDSIRDNIVALGYSKRNIKALYLRKPNFSFDESLVAINSDTVYVCLYVEHNDDTKSDSNDSDAMVDNDFNEHGSYVDDEEAARIIKEKQKMDKDHRADLEALRDEGLEFISGGNVFYDTDMFETNYQDSDYANSPPSSETDEDGNDERRKGVDGGHLLANQNQAFNLSPDVQALVQKALAAILGDYSEQFGMIRAYATELHQKNIEKEKNQSWWWKASPGGNDMYDVKRGSEGFVVDILNKTCTCGA
ncbi:hypothetical protein Cgig2_000616 [Carnegiea gigantea]|uniref:PB1-like domain-containing protein n=1 Tax=Carnegiea gigantea TaxID=171969 RepID=A0A9Q1JGQ0_9CARY|nr:hypothetical protein Cgig2_000616 [Carnegiea gigantea]